jgi:isopentenyl diphosphate isomerase/L-lactate dehydrogenase-like FMN-dependent dehydrogenase
MLHRHAELASAKAAGAAGTTFICNTISTFSLEEVAAASSAARWFQLYMPVDRGDAAGLLERVEASGYSTVCLTVDTAVGGKRDRDRRNRVSVPLKPTARNAFEIIRKPRWAIDFLRGGVGRGPAKLPMTINEAGEAVAATARPLTIEDLEWLRRRWSGNLVVKGVLRADDCLRVLDCGADGVVVSNHGGRQLDTAIPTVMALMEIAEVASNRGTLIVDGGIRRGTDVAKALALGAQAVLIGRPFLYGLAVAGQSGVERILEILRTELDATLALLGCRTVSELKPHHVQVLG